MRLRVKTPMPNSAKHTALLEALIAALHAPQDNRQPIITEDHRVRKGIVHVQVLWDRWQECSEIERWEIILEAYRQVRGEKYAEQIRLATGFTMPEAARIGLLPFQVVPRRPGANGLTPKQYVQAMIEESASTLENRSEPMLRFESLEEAEACQGRLEQRLPGSHWTIVQDLGSAFGSVVGAAP